MLLEEAGQKYFIPTTLDKYLGKLELANGKNLLYVLCVLPLTFKSNVLHKT